MLKSGLASVSFRGLPPAEIVSLAADAGLAGIEWGGDVHVPPGDLRRAERAAALTAARGLTVASYGSYYKLGAYGDRYEAAFRAVLETAKCLGAPTVRLWAGTKGSRETDEAARAAMVREAKTLAGAAQAAGITLAFERHPDTLTDCRASAVRLLDEIGSPAVKTYWQPDAAFGFEENDRTLVSLLPRLSNLHVFHWPAPGVRAPLAAGEARWLRWLARAAAEGGERWCLLEFMPDDDPASLPREAATLLRWLRELNTKGEAYADRYH